MTQLVLHHRDEGNCRVYYKAGPLLYCWQQESRVDGWHFYRCSRDGEPSHTVSARDGFTLPPVPAPFL